MDIAGARVLITGASRGIGAAMARRFADAGASVILAARSMDQLQIIATDVGGVAVELDAADPTQVAGFIERVENDHGPVDVLINNAGLGIVSLIEDIAEADIERLIRINLTTPQQLTRQVVPGMIERGRGHLVFTSSLAATGGTPSMSVYAASKGGLTRFAESLRFELTSAGLGVTVLHLGPIGTDMWEEVETHDVSSAAVRRGKKVGALSIGSVDEVAAATVAAVRDGKREVRIPKKVIVPGLLNGLGTRINELLYRGIDFRAEAGKT